MKKLEFTEDDFMWMDNCLWQSCAETAQRKFDEWNKENEAKIKELCNHIIILTNIINENKKIIDEVLEK